MADPNSPRAPGESSGGDVTNISQTTGDMRLIMQTLGGLGTKIDRLITDRKDDKDEIFRKIDEVRGDLRERIDGVRDSLVKGVDVAKTDVRERIDGVRQDHKDFIKDDFRPLREDVSKLRLKWAWMAGVGAVVGILVGLAIEIIKSHIH